MKCKNCGAEVTGQFCSECGKKVVYNNKTIVMRKRFNNILASLPVILIGLILILFAVNSQSCADSLYNRASSKLTDSDREIGIRAIEIIDGYLDFKIDKEDAEKRLEKIVEEIDEICEDAGYDEYEDDCPERYDELHLMSLDISLCASDIVNGDDVGALEQRNDVAKTVGYEKR